MAGGGNIGDTNGAATGASPWSGGVEDDGHVADTEDDALNVFFLFLGFKQFFIFLVFLTIAC